MLLSLTTSPTNEGVQRKDVMKSCCLMSFSVSVCPNLSWLPSVWSAESRIAVITAHIVSVSNELRIWSVCSPNMNGSSHHESCWSASKQTLLHCPWFGLLKECFCSEKCIGCSSCASLTQMSPDCFQTSRKATGVSFLTPELIFAASSVGWSRLQHSS